MKYFEKVSFKKRSLVHLWIIPFVGFLIGYIVTTFITQKHEVTVPNVIGKPLQESVVILSQHNLGVRLLQPRESATLPEGTVVDQMPRYDQQVRPNQNVFLTISIKKQAAQMPDLWAKKHQEALAVLAKYELDVAEVKLHTSYPLGMCIAQMPAPNQELASKKATLYVSQGKSPLCIMPNLKGIVLGDVQEAFKQYDMRAEIFHDDLVDADHVCVTCAIIDQQPAAGAIVNVAHGMQVQFKVGL